MNIHLATDHAGFTLKELIKTWLQDTGYQVVDHGALEHVPGDDFNEYIAAAAQAIQNNPDDKAIIFGGSGQGEAMLANRFRGVRSAVYYGAPATTQTDSDGHDLDIVTSTRFHNDANVLSIGARFVNESEAQEVVERWLAAAFSGEERHVRRINKIDQ